MTAKQSQPTVNKSCFARRRYGLIAVVIIAVLGCYSKDFQEPGIKGVAQYSTKRTYPDGFNATWDAALAALGELPVVTVKKEAGYILTDWIMGKSDRLYSGYGRTKIPYKIRYKFAVRIVPNKKGTLVSITNREQYYTDAISSGSELSGSLYHWADTESSTVKEYGLLNGIEAILNKKRKPN